MNGFEQIKSFYSWVFNNPDKVRPTHISLYLFLWNQANRANWAEWFKCPYDLAMQGACIGNKGTYYRCLDDLQEFKLIDYKKGINNFKAPQIHLIQLYKNEQLTEHVTVPLSEPLTVPLSEQLSVPIYKLITSNIKPLNNNKSKFEDFLNSLKGAKPQNEYVYSKFYDSQIDKSGNDEKYIHFVKFLFGQNELSEKLNGVLSIEKQLTFEQFNKLIHLCQINKVKLLDTVLKMENDTKYYKSKKNLYLTLNNWINQRFTNK